MIKPVPKVLFEWHATDNANWIDFSLNETRIKLDYEGGRLSRQRSSKNLRITHSLITKREKIES